MKRIAELAIAALVIAVVVMLIVPVPRPVLDALLALNIAASGALLMAWNIWKTLSAPAVATAPARALALTPAE